MTINNSFAQTLRSIFTDGGVLLFCVVVPLLYPVLYAFIYNGETVREVPVVVVDDSHSRLSREYLRRLDATADASIVGRARSIEEAKAAVSRREAYGVVYIPSDFQESLMTGRQTRIQLYCDMSGMLYYKALLTANTDVSLDMNAEIKVGRMGGNPIAAASGIQGGTAEQQSALQHPVRYEWVALFNAQSGFASFLIPAVLILVLQQTMLLGIGLITGTRRERKEKAPSQWSSFQTLTGIALAFIAFYIPVSLYVLGVVPEMFNLPHIGNLWEVGCLLLPFLVAVFNLGVTLGVLPRKRESVFLIVVFTSVPLLFLSGVSWPAAAFPPFWHYFAQIFPSTHGATAYIKLYCMGAHLSDVRTEYFALWAQAIIYGITAWLCVRYVYKEHPKPLQP